MATNKKPKLDTDNQVAAAAEEIALAELYEHQALLEKVSAQPRYLSLESWRCDRPSSLHPAQQPLPATSLQLALSPLVWHVLAQHHA